MWNKISSLITWSAIPRKDILDASGVELDFSQPGRPSFLFKHHASFCPRCDVFCSVGTSVVFLLVGLLFHVFCALRAVSFLSSAAFRLGLGSSLVSKIPQSSGFAKIFYSFLIRSPPYIIEEPKHFFSSSDLLAPVFSSLPKFES